MIDPIYRSRTTVNSSVSSSRIDRFYSRFFVWVSRDFLFPLGNAPSGVDLGYRAETPGRAKYAFQMVLRGRGVPRRHFEKGKVWLYGQCHFFPFPYQEERSKGQKEMAGVATS